MEKQLAVRRRLLCALGLGSSILTVCLAGCAPKTVVREEAATSSPVPTVVSTKAPAGENAVHESKPAEVPKDFYGKLGPPPTPRPGALPKPPIVPSGDR